MTDSRTIFRLQDIALAISRINDLLSDTDFATLQGDPVKRAAFERFLEILSEASRYIDDDLRSTEPSVPWRNIADIGNHLRHAYHRVDFEILWSIWDNGELGALHDAVMRMIAKLED